MKINKAKNKTMNRKGSIATVIITVGLVMIVLLSFPYFRALNNDTATATQNLGTQIKNVTQP